MQETATSEEIKDTLIKASKTFTETLEKEEKIIKGLLLSFYQTEKNIKEGTANIKMEAYVSKEDVAKIFLTVINYDEELKTVFLTTMIKQAIAAKEEKEKEQPIVSKPSNITYN